MMLIDLMARKKTSIYIDEEIWKSWTVYVVTNFGNRKLSEITEHALKHFMDGAHSKRKGG